MSNGRVAIIGGRKRRRRWGLEEKLRIVAETREPGACVRAVAARSTASVSPVVNDRHGEETIEIVLPDGCRLRVGNGVSLAALRRVVTALRG